MQTWHGFTYMGNLKNKHMKHMERMRTYQEWDRERWQHRSEDMQGWADKGHLGDQIYNSMLLRFLLNG